MNTGRVVARVPFESTRQLVTETSSYHPVQIYLPVRNPSQGPSAWAGGGRWSWDVWVVTGGLTRWRGGWWPNGAAICGAWRTGDREGRGARVVDGAVNVSGVAVGFSSERQNSGRVIRPLDEPAGWKRLEATDTLDERFWAVDGWMWIIGIDI